MTPQRCTATCKDGTPCRAWAVRGTDPPLCSAHRDHPNWGAPHGNDNALKHGYYADPDLPDDCTIDAVIDMLYQKQIDLDAYIDAVLHGADVGLRDLAHLFSVHGQNASRLGRLLRDRRALSGDAADGISGAIARALDELSTQMDGFT